MIRRNMSGRRTQRGADDSFSLADDKRKTGMEDLELIVEGKRVKTNSGLLSYNSNVFASLISNALSAKNADEDDVMDMMMRQERNESQQKLKLEMPDLKYKDVKVMIECLMSISTTTEDLTATKALRILPLVENFRIKRLKKACGKTLYDSIIAMRRDLGTGSLPTRDLLQYLAAADVYNFDKLRRVCIDELARNIDPKDRIAIQSDKHVHEKSKVKIFGKMYDIMDREYESRVRQVRHDMDGRCRLLEQKRDEYMEQLETWKNDLRQDVDDLVKQNEDAHKQFIKDLYQKKIVNQIDGTLNETKEGLFEEMEKLQSEVNYVFQTMEANEQADEAEIAGLKQYLEEAIEKNQQNIKSITDTFKEKLEQKLCICSLNAASLKTFSSSKNLEENVSANIDELENRIESLARFEIQYEEEVIAHKKAQGELLKIKQKEHQMNTWLKWATPAIDDEDKCQCYRHAVARK